MKTLPSPEDYKWKLDEYAKWHGFALKRMLESYGEGDYIYDDIRNEKSN